MPYQIFEQWSSPNFDTPEQMPYIQDGEKRVIESGTIHHWDDPANHPTFERTIATLCNPAAGRSAHNVIQDGRVACIVSNVNCAWHAGNWHGNATSIGYECSPYMTDGDYLTIGEKIADDWKAFGVFPLVPHSSWTATSCPGGYDLERIRATAERFYRGTTPTAPAPAAPAPAPAKYQPDFHWEVDPGDSMWGIAAQPGFNCDVNRLAAFNGINLQTQVLTVGEWIWPPNGYGTWTIDPGDTLTSIVTWCKQNWNQGISMESICNANGINNPNILPPIGRRLVIR